MKELFFRGGHPIQAEVSPPGLAAGRVTVALHYSAVSPGTEGGMLDRSGRSFLALALEKRQNLRVVTNGLDVARLLAKNPSNTVILVGGILSPDGSSLTGLFSEQAIRELHVQKAFISASGFSLERGLTEVHLAEAQLKRKAIESARQVIALVDAGKLGHEDLTPFARIEQITHLFTDSGITTAWKDRLQAANLPCTICEV